MVFLLPLFWVIILLGIMILIHEVGHFGAALAVGVKVETFSIGFGPRLLGFRRGDTDFRISAIPFGGYVRMLGEQAGDEKAADPRAFQSKARWQRAIVILAGPAMNVVLAVAIVAGLYMYAFPKEAPDPVITSVAAGSPAAESGFEPGDKIVEIGGKTDPNWQDVMGIESLNANHPLPVIVDRRGTKLNLTVTPRMDAKQGIGVAGWGGEQDVQIRDVVQGSPAEAAGLRPGDLLLSVNGQTILSPLALHQAIIHSGGHPVALTLMRNNQVQTVTVTPAPSGDAKAPWRVGISFRFKTEIVRLPFPQAVVESMRFNAENATMIFRVLGSIVERRVSPKALAGPIGIAQMSSEAAAEGPLPFLLLMSVVSLNLAIFNLLPIPILDGDTLLLLIVEMLLQREVSVQVKETILKLGFAFLMMVVLFVIYNDISRIVTKG